MISIRLDPWGAFCEGDLVVEGGLGMHLASYAVDVVPPRRGL